MAAATAGVSVAAFVGGLAFGASTKGSLRRPTEFTETLGLFSSFFVWTVFGAIFVGPVLTTRLDAAAIVYAVLSLTLVRMVPVAISLVGTHLRFDTVVLMGWFGPRGLASVVFTLVAVDAIHESGAAFDAIVEVATWTILLSRSWRTGSRPARSRGPTDDGSRVPVLCPSSRTYRSIGSVGGSSALPDPGISLCGRRDGPCGDDGGGYAEPEPDQCSQRSGGDRQEPERPGEVPHQEVEPHVLGVLDHEDDQEPNADERCDRPTAEPATFSLTRSFGPFDAIGSPRLVRRECLAFRTSS